MLASENKEMVTLYQKQSAARSGFLSLIVDLAETLHIPYTFADLPERIPHAVALISDEFGIVTTEGTPWLFQLQQASQKLFTK